jgi:hypothetical protein
MLLSLVCIVASSRAWRPAALSPSERAPNSWRSIWATFTTSWVSKGGGRCHLRPGSTTVSTWRPIRRMIAAWPGSSW